MSVPHQETSRDTTEKGRNWLENARKDLIQNKVDWSVSELYSCKIYHNE